jgi:superfamily II DNA/RNA helicase
VNPSVGSFAQLPLEPQLLTVLSANSIAAPLPIQAATLPDLLAGRDVLGRARTGSGKTLAFGLAVLSRTAGRRAMARRPLALVLVPTRELAQQVSRALSPYATALKLRSATVVGGLSLQRQADVLRAGAEVVIATPGRLIDLVQRGACHLDEVTITVLDEADRMADMGFLPQVSALLDMVAPGGQRMLFSATLDRDVDGLVRRFLTAPVIHSVDPPVAAVTTMAHHVLHVQPADKLGATAEIAAREGRVLLFTGTKYGADRLARQLLASGVPAAALHGGKSQPQRTRILEQFRAGHVTALVATDVAARGLHIDELHLVVNVDPPTAAKDYLHRGGRTARAGGSGTVVTLVLPEQRREVNRLLAAAGVTAESAPVRPGDVELRRVTGGLGPPPERRAAHGSGGARGRAARARPTGLSGNRHRDRRSPR